MRGHLDLAGQQDVLAGLGHRAVRRGHHQDGAVHLGRAGDHVLDVVGVARAVHVRVVALVGLVLDVRDGDGDAARALLGRVVDLVERAEVGPALERQDLRDRRRQRRLAVVDVPDRADVHVRLGALETSASPWCFLRLLLTTRSLAARPCAISSLRCLLRNFCVVGELHRVAGAALGHAAQLGGVAEHLGQRHHGPDDLRVAARLDALDLAAAALMSPSTSPKKSSGVVTSTFMIGSSMPGRPCATPSLRPSMPAILNAISDESTAWNEPSTSVTLTSTTG